MKKVASLYLFLLLLILTAVSSPREVEAAEKAGSSGAKITGLQTVSEDEFISLLGIRDWKQADAETVRTSIKRAFLKGVFDDIAVTVHDGDPRLTEVNVRERDYIGKVHIEGNYQLSRRQIKQAFLLKEGELMRYDLMDRASEDLRLKLVNLGFPSAAVRLASRSSQKPYIVDLYLDVTSGPPLIIKSVTVTGPKTADEKTGVSGSRLRDMLKVAPGDVYNAERIGNELRELKNQLKKQGYIKPVVGPFSFADGVLDVHLSPGKKLNVTFDGLSAVSGKDLLRESLLQEIEDFSDEVVGEAVDRMLAFYHANGYPHAQIAPVIHSSDEEFLLTFFVFEGEKVKVGSIAFTGTRLSPESLKQVMQLKESKLFNPDLIEKDQELVREFLGALGYLESNVRKIEVRPSAAGDVVDLVMAIEDGEKTVIGSLEITGVVQEQEASLKSILGIKSGDAYNDVDISDARFRIIEYYTNRGYASADVAVNRKIEGHRASVVFAVSEGQKRYLGKTVITGNRRTRYPVIRRELMHKEGEAFNLGQLADERQKLYKLGLFTDVEIEPIDVGGGKSDILVRVNEGNAGSVEFGAGYADYEKFRGFAEVSYRNLWGMNRMGLARVEISSLEQRLLLQYNDPWFFSRSLPLSLYFQYDNRTEINVSKKETLYHLRRYTLTAGGEKKLSDVLKAELYYEFSLVNTTEVAPDVVLTKEDTGTLAIGSIKPGIVYDTRDNPFDPEKGGLAGATLKVAAVPFFSETNFVKLEVYGSRFKKLAKGLVLGVFARGGYAYHFGDTHELPIVERFFLGGRSSVRGYDQDTLGPKGSDGNPTGGNYFVMGSIELRTSLGMGIGIVPFVDAGNVWANARDMSLSDLKYTAGLGLRYKTPVGPLRVDYGFKLNRNPGDSMGAIHFSVGHAF